MLSQLGKLWSDESGQAVVEYGVIIAVIAVLAVGVLTMFWGRIEGMFTGIADNLDGVPAVEAGG